MAPKKVAVLLTPKQIAALEEAANHYLMYSDVSAPGQRRSTQTAADNLSRAFTATREVWPW